MRERNSYCIPHGLVYGVTPGCIDVLFFGCYPQGLEKTKETLILTEWQYLT